MRELGHDLVYSMQRCFVAPKDMPAGAVAYYTEMFSKLNRTARMAEIHSDEALDADFMTGEDLQAYFLASVTNTPILLTGMAKALPDRLPQGQTGPGHNPIAPAF